ncbi:MAG: S24 family peptidase, partial [Cytophagales bacterium]|nr:S24 family peptidase [Cytophagales bacterium]
KHIKSGECYVVLTLDEGLVYKRLYNRLDQGELLLKSDNPDYHSYTITTENILEIWKAKAFLSFALPSEAETLPSVQHLALELAELRREVTLLQQDATAKPHV